MRETLELRILRGRARELFSEREIRSLGDTERGDDEVCRVEVRRDDPRYPQVGAQQVRASATGQQPFFYGWRYHRHYSSEELDSAEIFHFRTTTVFEPAGEDCGTRYDESTRCPVCGAGRTQMSPLTLDLRRLPKGKEIARTIAHEWVFSQRLAELLTDSGMTGFELRPVRHRASYDDATIHLDRYGGGRELLARAQQSGVGRDTWEFMVWLNRPEQMGLLQEAWHEHARTVQTKERQLSASPLPKWYQLVITASSAEIADGTQFGIEPFDMDEAGRYRCPFGHVSGLNVLSELSLVRKTWDGNDIAQTKQLVGVREGLLVPAPMLLISPRLQCLLEEKRIKGYSVEVAHLV